MPLDTINFRNNGPLVTRIGLGGEGVLRTFGREREARSVIFEALKQGITYFDTAAAYAGSQGYYGRIWREAPEARDQIFQTSKSAERSAAGAARQLDETLETLGLDHLDLWQIHDVRTREDLDEIAGPGGALEAFVKAKKAGKTRFIGVTGHHDPSVLTRAVKEWPLDSVLLPVNPVEAALGGFLTDTLPAARQKGMAVIGMKTLGAGNYLFPESGVTPDILLRFALAQPVTLVIVGCSTPGEVKTLAEIGAKTEPMPESDQWALTDAFRPLAKRLAYYRGRVQADVTAYREPFLRMDWKDISSDTIRSSVGRRWLMDLNYILIWLVGLNCGVTIFRLFRSAGRGGGGWLAVNILILLAMGGAYFRGLSVEGYVGAALWIPLVWGPTMGQRLMHRKLVQENYGQAYWAARLTALLHPFGVWRRYPKVIRALALQDQGRSEAAEAVINDLRASDPNLSENFRAIRLKAEGRWEELVAWLSAPRTREDMHHRKSFLVGQYLRALGETGDVNALLTAYREFAPIIPRLSDRYFIYLVVAAFTGSQELTSRLLYGPLALMKEEHRLFWMATAGLNAGHASASREVFEYMLGRSMTGLSRDIIRQRQRTTIPPAESRIAAENKPVLEAFQHAVLSDRKLAENAKQARFEPFLTYSIIAGLAVVFVIQTLTGLNEGSRHLFQFGAMWTPAVAAGQWWRVITANFLHVDIIHLGMNGLGLYLLGPFVENRLGRIRFSLVYFFSGLGCMVFIYLLERHHLAPPAVTVGASGSISGLVGAIAVIYLRGWLVEGVRAAKRVLAAVGLIVALQLAFDLSTPASSLTGHVSGLLVGLALTALILPWKRRKIPE